MKARRCWPAPSRSFSTRRTPTASRSTSTRSPTQQWARTQLVYVCSPANPTGRVLTLDEWRALFERSDRYGFVIASDECYSEIYDDAAPPLGALEAAQQLGRDGFREPGGVHQPVEAIERAGTAVGRRGRRCGAAPAVSAVSHLSWMRDEPRRAARQHRRLERRGARRENRRQYREKFDALVPMLRAGDARAAGRTPASICGRACRAATTRRSRRELFAATHVTVLPGQYLGAGRARREPGRGYVRMALVPELARLRRGRPAHRGSSVD